MAIALEISVAGRGQFIHFPGSQVLLHGHKDAVGGHVIGHESLLIDAADGVSVHVSGARQVSKAGPPFL